MGKRRKEGPQADKFNPNIASEDEDEEEIENNLEKEPLCPEEIANIKARKKLIATRRIPSATTVNGSATVTSSFGFTPFAPFNPPATNTDTDNKPSVFSGFKGFMSAAKPAATSSSSTITLTTTTTNGTSSESIPRQTLTISEPTKPLAASLSTTKPSESTTPLFKPSESVTTPKPDNSTTTSTAAANNLSHSNICETDLNFMNDLNDLYERYYGSIKEKNFTIPSDILNGSDLVFEQESSQDGMPKKTDEEDESKKKYACLLADLNKHCSKWISKHVEENPLVILTPVFVDYFAYLILLEKNFFPNTFNTKKEKPTNGTSAPVSTTLTASLTTSTSTGLFKFGSSTNGGGAEHTSTLTSVPSFGSTSTTSSTKNGTDSDSHKHLNGGFKFAPLATTTSHVNGASKQEVTPKKTASEELAESEEKNLEQSSKTFASLITKTPFSQIPLTTSGATPITTAASSFLFKPTEPSSTTDNKKDTTDNTKEMPYATTPKVSLPSQETPSLFKFGQVASSSSTTGEIKPAPTETTTTNTMNKFSLFSSTTAPTFKFGDLSKPAPAVSTVASSSVPAAATSSPSSQQTTSLFSKPAEPTSAETTKPSNFFANLSKPNTTLSTPDTTTTSTTTSTVPTFSSLLSGSSSANMFKPFSSNLDQTASTTSSTTSTTTPSIFSSLNAPAATGTSAPFFSFKSALGSSNPSIFGQSATTTPGTNLFSAATAPILTAGGVGNPEGEEGGEEEYEPPKPEASDVKEEGSVFEKRIKLYYFSEKENKFTDRGVGNLFLKPINKGESTQLIVRADTSLANILLNVKLTKMFPITKLGAKDVSYICVPNPPIPNVDSKAPCKFLFKVKTEDDAKELLDKLNELKK